MDHEDLLRDLQVLLVLLVLLVRMGLRAFLDLLGRKASQVQRGLQGLTANLVQKGLLGPLVFLENQACQAYLFLPFQARRDQPVQEAPVLQEALDLQVSSDPLGSAQQELLDQLGRVASMDWQDLLEKAQQDPLEMLDQLEQVVPLVLPDLLVKGLLDLSDLSDLPALPEAQQEILALSALGVLLVRPDLQGQMDTV